jgi:CBS domain-containing protein
VASRLLIRWLDKYQLKGQAMNSAIERLLCLRVSDVMTRDVEVVAADRPMAVAAATLVNHGISGLPVVGGRGQCLGMLTATDFVRRSIWATDEPNAPAGGRGETSLRTLTDAVRNRPATDLVASYMSPTLQTVSTTDSLVDAARLMCRRHIHRLVVLDDQARPIGVVTSLDIVAAFVGAIEE